jgi:putative DNA primase/helicase
MNSPTRFARWHGAGFTSELLPIIPPGSHLTPGTSVQPHHKGKVPGVLTAQQTWSGLAGQWSQEFATENDCKRWHKWGASVGLQGRNFPGIDIDVDNQELASKIKDCAGYYLGFGPIRTRQGSNRALLMFRAGGTARGLLRKVRCEFHDREGAKHAVELLATGQQYVVEGPHPAGGEYEWLGDHPCNIGSDGLPEIDAQAVERFFSALRTTLESQGCKVGKGFDGLASPSSGARKSLGDASLHAPQPGMVIDLLVSTPCTVERFPDRDAFVPWVCAIKASLGVYAKTYWPDVLAWALEYPGCEEHFVAKIWDSVNDSALGWDWLCSAAGSDIGAQHVFDDGERESPINAPEPDAAYSHDAIALRFADLHVEDARFAASWGKWFEWSADHWRADEKLHMMTIARQVCRQVAHQGANANLKRQLLSANTIAGVVSLARCDPRLAIAIDEFDRDPWLLNTPAGTIELKTGHTRGHQDLDYITKVTAASPSGARQGEGSPLWQRFIGQITGQDAKLAAFIQRMLGYALTGSTQEQCLFFLYGRGANGKSVLLNTVSSILAGYHTTAPIEAFTASATERHPTELAGLRGARLVTAIETEEGRRWAEAKIKSLTGGDKIAARFMRQDFFEFTPQFKLIIAGNHKPTLRTVDEAIRRRFHLVPFTVTIPPDQRDKNLAEKLKAEWPGILQWMIDGCLAWQRDGLNPPAAVREATKEYLEAEDAMATWMTDCCTVDRDAFESNTTLFMSWCGWAKNAGEPFGSQRAFTQKLGERLKPERTNATRGFKGLKIIKNEESSDGTWA